MEQKAFRCLVGEADIKSRGQNKGDGYPRFTAEQSMNFLSSTATRSTRTLTRTTYADAIRALLQRRQGNTSHAALQDRQADVGRRASAYRNASIHSEKAYMFAGNITAENVIDLSSAFGWTDNFETYGILCGGVAFIHTRVNHEQRVPQRALTTTTGLTTTTNCFDIERPLHQAMAVGMDPASVNEDKFTPQIVRPHL
ncbi:hypothetical protein GQ600_11427 [Phytophthora cactorum]|nr:hypothetical protein GQ600_11427 [Phytophthora cactorum]